MPLPAVSFDDSTWYFHYDKDLVAQVTEILKPLKLSKRSLSPREHLRAKRDGDINTVLQKGALEGSRKILENGQVVRHLSTSIGASHIPGTWNSIQGFPGVGAANQVDSDTLQIVFFILMGMVGKMAPAQVPQERLSWLTASILGIVYAYLTDPQNQEMIMQSFNVPRRGIVGNGCPKKEDNECGHRLCQGTNEVCEYTFLKGCACSDTCPNEEGTIRWFICDEEECGGADDFGECKGATGGPSIGANKGCYCAHIEDGEPLTRDTSHYAELQKFLSGNIGKPDSGKPDGEAVKRKQCYKEDQERMKDHTNWKFVQQAVLDQTIKQQCDKLKQSGEPGYKDLSYMEMKEDWDYAKLRYYEPEPGMVTQELCHSKFLEISAGCDSSPLEENNPNQFNWKWGGEVELENGIIFIIEPVWSRVWTDGSYTQPDFASCAHGDRFSDKGGKGNNGAELNDWAKMTLQQCIHQAKYLGHTEYLDCGGLLNMNLRLTYGYESVKDCWETNWKCVSYNIEIGQSGRGSHHPGAPDCWLDLMFA